jgi:hypothetical protein
MIMYLCGQPEMNWYRRNQCPHRGFVAAVNVLLWTNFIAAATMEHTARAQTSPPTLSVLTDFYTKLNWKCFYTNLNWKDLDVRQSLYANFKDIQFRRSQKADTGTKVKLKDWNVYFGKRELSQIYFLLSTLEIIITTTSIRSSVKVRGNKNIEKIVSNCKSLT